MNFIRYKVVAVISLLALGLSGCNSSTKSPASCFTVFNTNDLHSHIAGFPLADDNPEKIGGPAVTGNIARIATLIDQERIKSVKAGPVLVLDAGDVLMGTIFSSIDQKIGSEYQLLKSIGYDAVALGNHEFDYGPQPLAQIINAARAGLGVPQLLLSNWVLSNDSSVDGLKKLVADGVIKPYVIVNKDGLKFGIFGLMGKDAATDIVPASTSVISFKDPIVGARAIVDELRNKEHVDVVIALSHSGVTVNPDGLVGGEDVELAKEVQGINLVVSGHTHTLLEKAVVVNNTPVVQVSSYGEYLGKVEMCRVGNNWTLNKYEVLPVNQNVLGKPAILRLISNFVSKINDLVLKPFGITYGQPMAHLDADFTGVMGDPTLGNIVTDAFRASGDSSQDIAFISGGALRDNLQAGSTGVATVSDVYRVVPLGIGWDGVPGYPLVRMYLLGLDLKNVMEGLIQLRGPSGNSANYIPHISGVRVKYNPNGASLNKVVEIARLVNGSYLPMDISAANTMLYPVVTDLYDAELMGKLGALVHVIPKTAAGAPITDWKVQRLLDNSGKEVKEWMSLNNYLKAYSKRTVGTNLADLKKVDFSEQRIPPVP